MTLDIETEVELGEHVEGLLGEALTQMLRDATDALERLAPREFEAIGTRALDLDTLMIHASAAAALPEVMARFRVIAATRRAHAERYDASDWAAAAVAARVRPEEASTTLREVPQDRFEGQRKGAAWVR